MLSKRYDYQTDNQTLIDAVDIASPLVWQNNCTR